MNKQKVIENTISFVKEKLNNDVSGHDWWHVFRVWQLAKQIAEKEGGNLYVIELGALLHDIADWKFHNGNIKYGADLAEEFLINNSVNNTIILQVREIILNVSFKGAGIKSEIKSLEGKIVQDADRIDALGAIGIARTFAYGGFVGNPIYVPDQKPVHHNTFEEYQLNNSSTINHFYEKLFLLKDRMNTNFGKSIAEKRHKYMLEFIEKFHAEWNFK